MQLRDATFADIPAITAIYNHAVAHTLAIWNEVLVDEANRRAWVEARLALGYPVLVAENAQGEVVGYASYGDWRAFEGYRYTVEHSVYVRADQRGTGIGRKLMELLIERARAGGKHVMVAGIEAGNTASIRLHGALGFEPAGTLRQVGTKFGQWLDLAFMQLLLDHETVPEPKKA